MTIPDDGKSLYVVNYNSNTVAKVDAATLEVLQTLPVPLRPIGIAFDDARREVWVASYSGAISVFAETAAHDEQSMKTPGPGSQPMTAVPESGGWPLTNPGGLRPPPEGRP